MPFAPQPQLNTTELDERLRLLYLERALAELNGLMDDPAYRRDLQDEIANCRVAYVAVAVTEIASLRAALSGWLQG